MESYGWYAWASEGALQKQEPSVKNKGEDVL